MSKARIGSFGDLLDITPETLRPVVTALRELFYQCDPDTTEVVRLGDRAATYGVGPRKMLDGYAYILPHKNWVNLGFYQGFALPDSAGLLEGTGAKMRHVKIRSLADASRPEVKALIHAAIALRRKTQ